MPRPSTLLALANWIGEQTGATVGYLTEAANTVGAQLVGALPGQGGLNAGQMLAGGLKAADPAEQRAGVRFGRRRRPPRRWRQAEMVVTLSPFKANLEFSDVLLPIAPFTETPGTFVNAEGRVQSFHAVVKPLGETRPAWKVLRVLANLLGLRGFELRVVPRKSARWRSAAAVDAHGQRCRRASSRCSSARRRRSSRRDRARRCSHAGRRPRSTSSTASCAARRRCSSRPMRRAPARAARRWRSVPAAREAALGMIDPIYGLAATA